MPVEWKDAFFRDGEHPQTLEDAVMVTAAYGGVHDFDFQNDVDESFSVLTNWILDDDAEATVSASFLELMGGGGSNKWYLETFADEISLGLVASFDYIGGVGGFFFKKATADSRCFICWFSSTYIGFSYADSDGLDTQIFSIPVGIAAPARLQVQARYSLDSVDDERKWIQAGLYIDGTLYIAFAEDVGGTALDWDGEGVGFCAHESDLLQVDNFTISSLHRLVEWTTIDPGSSPASGMARAIGSTRVSYMCRYDDTLRVWRPGNRDLDWTVESGRWTRLDTRTSIDSPNHVRVQAAIHESDGFSNDDIRDRMHRFAIHNDPNIMSEHEAYLESQRVLHDHKERAKVVRFVTPPNYLLEPNDRIYIDGADWRVVSVNTVVTVESNRPRIASVIEAQRYTELIEQGAYPWVLE